MLSIADRSSFGRPIADHIAFRWLALAGVALLGSVLSAHAADPVKVGPEIVVAPEEIRFTPRVASDAAGNFLVVWQDYDGAAHGRRWFANGNESLPQFEISKDEHYLGTASSTSTGDLAVAGDAAGNFMVTYTAYDTTETEDDYFPCSFEPCLFTRRNDANGITGPSFLVQDPLTTYVYQALQDDQVSNPEIADLANGDFVVVWEGYDAVAYPDDPGYFYSDEGTFAAKATSLGQRKGSYFRVNDIALEYQGQYGTFSADGDAEGNFVVIFRSEYDYEFPGGTLHAQLYDDKGKPIGTEFGISSNDDDGTLPDVARAPDGTWMAVWAGGEGLTARLFDGDGTPRTDDFLVFDDVYYSAIAASEDAFVVLWSDGPDVLGRRFDLFGNELSSAFLVNTSPAGSDAVDVATATNGDFVATWKDTSGEPRAQQFQANPPVEQEIGVFGRSLVISNKLPDDPEKNKITWKASGASIVVPPRGTTSDPRCNGDPPGTVKATLEFASPTSGHGSGVLGLPCENWVALGGNAVDQVATRSYRYFDGPLDDGPCGSVLIVGTKSIAVTCKGSGDTTDLPYDLVPGTSEGTVHAVLDMNLHRFCSSFPPSGGADGSDGKKFKGKSAPIAPCP